MSISSVYFPNKIALVGHAYSGKSSTAREIQKRYGHKIISLASPIKEVDWAFRFLGLPAATKAEKRRLYHVLGIWARQQNQNFFIELLKQKYSKLLFEPKEKVVVDDCRFLNEAVFFTLNGFALIYVDCPKEELYKRAFENGEDPEVLYSYESEQEIEEIVKVFSVYNVSGIKPVDIAVSELEEQFAQKARKDIPMA